LKCQGFFQEEKNCWDYSTIDFGIIFGVLRKIAQNSIVVLEIIVEFLEFRWTSGIP
jgi:hypothetical protein